MLVRKVGIGAGLLRHAGAMVVQTGSAEGVPITGPAELASLGMPRDAKDVSRWPKPAADDAGRSGDRGAADFPQLDHGRNQADGPLQRSNGQE
jgi:hypothetical protein